MSNNIGNIKTGAELVAQTIVDLGIDMIFGYPGGAIMPVHDALYIYETQGKIKHYVPRHEQGGIHALEGYARASGKVGVIFVTSGPGATNLVTGIADALMDSVPVICITGQVATHLIGTEAFQETDIINVTKPITKWNYQIRDPREIPYVFEKAYYIATTGRPGPVLIDIPKDIQTAKVNLSEVLHFEIPKESHVIEDNLIREAAELINTSQRPLVLVGHGAIISNAHEEIKELLEKGHLPFACTLHGLSALPKTHPNYVGFLGMHGNYAPNKLTNEADLLIALGMRFDDRVTGNLKKYAPNAKVIHIDIEKSKINRNVPTTIGINADLKTTLKQLNKYIKFKDRKTWFDRFSELYSIETEKVIKNQTNPVGDNILMAEVIKLLSDITDGNANIVADVGQHQMIAARYYEFNRFNSFFSSGGLGTMGFALPAAIGVKLARPDEEVIAIIGDGGFQMTMQELALIAYENIPVKIIILNNGFLGMVRQWQELFFDKRYAYTNMCNPDFVKLTEAYGIQGRRIDSKSQLKDGLIELVQSDKGYLLEIIVQKEDMVFPMVPPGASVEDVILESPNLE